MAKKKSKNNKKKNKKRAQTAQDPIQEPAADPIQEWVWEHRSQRHRVGNQSDGRMFTHPDEKGFVKAQKEYLARKHIAAISNEKLRRMAAEVEKDLDWLEVPYGWITAIEVKTTLEKTYGSCRKLDPAKCSLQPGPEVGQRMARSFENGDLSVIRTQTADSEPAGNWQSIFESTVQIPYVIYISDMLLDESVPLQSLYETLMHEYIHSCPGCLNHGPRWKNLAEQINYVLGTHISRTGSSEKTGTTAVKKERARYIVRCQECGHEYFRSRMCDLVAHPDRYRCSCGGVLELVRGQEEAARKKSSPTGTVKLNASEWKQLNEEEKQQAVLKAALEQYPYVLRCEKCSNLVVRKRMCDVIQNPEHYACGCGGRMIRVK